MDHFVLHHVLLVLFHPLNPFLQPRVANLLHGLMGRQTILHTGARQKLSSPPSIHGMERASEKEMFLSAGAVSRAEIRWSEGCKRLPSSLPVVCVTHLLRNLHWLWLSCET